MILPFEGLKSQDKPAAYVHRYTWQNNPYKQKNIEEVTQKSGIGIIVDDSGILATKVTSFGEKRLIFPLKENLHHIVTNQKTTLR